jgi:hypothetical protein
MVAIAWEFWSANRRGWLLMLAALALCGLVVRWFGRGIHDAEARQFLCYLPLVGALILAVSFCNFTDRNSRDGIAGFPRHLFTLPVNTRLTVTCAIVYSLVSVLGIYVAWVELVMQPLDVATLVRWPATLLAAFVVLYQAIIWCLCGFRLTRVVSLSLVATVLVGVGFIPTLVSAEKFWASELNLSGAIVAVMALAYGATLATVGVQRRGGARGLALLPAMVESISRTLPRNRCELKSADAALFWIEWRRTGWILPVAVFTTMTVILGPVLALTGGGREATFRIETWLAILPILLAVPIGLGFGKPDFWSFDLSLSPFLTTRPVTAGQILAARLKSAACSSALAWAIVVAIAPIGIYLLADTKHWQDVWGVWSSLYSPVALRALLFLLLGGAVFLTWSLLVSTLWLGYSGRSALYHTFSAVGLGAFVAWFFFYVWWLDHPRTHGNLFVEMLPWLPWALAALLTTKVWGAVFCVRHLRRRRLVTDRGISLYLAASVLAVACIVFAGSLFSPRIEWLRNAAILAALNTIPVLTIIATPFAIAWNRHR